MKIREIGGEFALIDRLSQIVPNAHGDLVAGVGDDAAVIRTAPEPAPYLLVTTDILVEERHFRRQWAQPEQIGLKAAESNISDIAAMGGKPTWMFISLVLSKHADVTWAQRLYDGIGTACRRHGAIVAGGDTTRGSVNTITITLLGTVSPAHLCLRSHARPGDLLMVTGPLGASAAALALLARGESVCDYLLEKHLTPTCRLDVAATIAPLANAMIDISDGLGSEVHHICNRSRVSAEVHADTLPLHHTVRAAGEALQMPPMDFAIQGGEDYELLFSLPEENVPALEKTGITFHKVGCITAGDANPVLVTAEGRQPLKRGYNHFG
jgi:thiamine-monophosphate kinase